MIEYHHPDRATHHRSLDMLMEVKFVLLYAERSVSRLRANGQEPTINTLQTQSELEQLRQHIQNMPSDQALMRAEAIRTRAQKLFGMLQA